MSAVVAMPPVKRGDNTTPSVSPAAPAAVAFHYTQTASFVALLEQLGASLVVTTYQANKLLVARIAGAGLSMLVRTFDRPMDGVPLARRKEALKCGVAAVDLRSGHVVGLLEFQTAVEEIFDVQVLAGLRFPEVVGFQKEEVQHTFIVPPENSNSATTR